MRCEPSQVDAGSRTDSVPVAIFLRMSFIDNNGPCRDICDHYSLSPDSNLGDPERLFTPPRTHNGNLHPPVSRVPCSDRDLGEHLLVL